MSSDSNQTVFSYKLSAPLKDDCESVFANVTRNRWEAPDGSTIYLVRFALKQFRGKKTNQITISLTSTQFDWIIHCLEHGIASQIVPGEREGKYICFENPEKISGSTIISVIDKKSKFGILLDSSESTTLRASAKIISFIIKFQHASGDKLKELLRYLYSFCIISIMENEIKSNCQACMDESIIESEHVCKNIPNNLINEYFENSYSKRNTIEERYSEIFSDFMNLLNVSEHNRQQAKDMLLSIVKEEKKEMISSIKEYFSIEYAKSNAFAVSALTALKEQKEETEKSLIIQNCNEVDESGLAYKCFESQSKKLKF
jgi:hypothetical protein